VLGLAVENDLGSGRMLLSKGSKGTYILPLHQHALLVGDLIWSGANLLGDGLERVSA